MVSSCIDLYSSLDISRRLEPFNKLTGREDYREIFSTFEDFLENVCTEIDRQELPRKFPKLKGRVEFFKRKSLDVINAQLDGVTNSYKIINLILQTTATIQFLQEEALYVGVVKILIKWLSDLKRLMGGHNLDEVFCLYNEIINPYIKDGDQTIHENILFRVLIDFLDKISPDFFVEESNFIIFFYLISGMKESTCADFCEIANSFHLVDPEFIKIRTFLVGYKYLCEFAMKNSLEFRFITELIETLRAPTSNHLNQRKELVPVIHLVKEVILKEPKIIHTFATTEFEELLLGDEDTNFKDETIFLFQMAKEIQEIWNRIFANGPRTRKERSDKRLLEVRLKVGLPLAERGPTASSEVGLDIAIGEKLKKVGFALSKSHPFLETKEEFLQFFQLHHYFKLANEVEMNPHEVQKKVLDAKGKKKGGHKKGVSKGGPEKKSKLPSISSRPSGLSSCVGASKLAAGGGNYCLDDSVGDDPEASCDEPLVAPEEMRALPPPMPKAMLKDLEEESSLDVLVVDDPEASCDEPLVAPKERRALPPPMSKKIVEELEAGQAFYKEILIHERVKRWVDNPGSAVEKYLIELKLQKGQGCLTRDEIRFSHTFPLELLPVIFSHSYSIKSVWKSPYGKNHNRHRGIVVFEGKRHVLEATINEANVLYHFSARPINEGKDLLMLVNAPTEFPELGKISASCKSPVARILGSFIPDEDENMHFGPYKILKLRR